MDIINEIAFVWLGDLCVRVDQVQAVTQAPHLQGGGSFVYLQGQRYALHSNLTVIQAMDAIDAVNAP